MTSNCDAFSSAVLFEMVLLFRKAYTCFPRYRGHKQMTEKCFFTTWIVDLSNSLAKESGNAKNTLPMTKEVEST